MQALPHNVDLLHLAAGAVAAAVAGLMLGTAMQPDFEEGAIQGPQQLLDGGGPRTYAQANDPGVGVYRHGVPEYVIGTDATRPRIAQLPPLYAEPEPAQTAELAAHPVVVEPPRIAPARWQDEPRAPSRYPSQAGGAWNESDLPAPPSDIPAVDASAAPA